MVNYKDSLFLPQTDFSMKGNLKQLEPQLLKQWQDQNLYLQICEADKGKTNFILHWGPPYANGHLHIGHALTSILKDITCRNYRLKNYNAPLVPGWDCHGLPIEWKVEEQYRQLKRNKDDIPILEFRAECRKYAKYWIDIQNTEFQRLGILYDANNPYITMDFESEGLITETILDCLESGIIYKGIRPIMWSVIEKTALAEAEIEYLDKESNSIYVSFPIKSSENNNLKDAHAIIWTTTPWTLPGNRAIAYHNDIDYCIVQVADRKYLLAYDLITAVSNNLNWKNVKVIEHLSSPILSSTIAYHPLHQQGYTFDVPFIAGDHVTTSAGTGLVHTAPGHGIEDFAVSKLYNLEIPETVNGDGYYYDHIPLFSGIHIYKADQAVINALGQENALLSADKIIHSYPHSWRSKKPLIFRTTPQWFIAMDDDKNIRDQALMQIKQVEWFPKSAHNRIRSMIENRPDWCISRQRGWGVPIPIFISKKTGAPLIDTDVNQRIVAAVKQHGCDIWFKNDHQQFLGEQYSLKDYEVVKDVIDVWFESGATQHFVLEQRPDLNSPADVYLEGSDQHRGWFQSSLLIGCATNNRAPFKKVITHGFTVDERGRKMSKSLGNTLSLDEAITEYGAEIIRLWVASCDYTDDLRIGHNLLRSQQDIYRRYRNTLRYLLGALKGIDEPQQIDYAAMPLLEKWILHQIFELDQQFSEMLITFNYQNFYANLHNFCATVLSAFYFDIRKDCLYCDRTDSPKRQATLFVLHYLFNFLIRVLSPVLCFTTEEAWMSRCSTSTSIHLQKMMSVPDYFYNPLVATQLDKIRLVRRDITAALEQARIEGIIRSSLQANVIYCDTERLIDDVDQLTELCIVSSITLTHEGQNNKIIITNADGEKCERCWKVLPTVGVNSKHPSLCSRCVTVVQ